MPFKTLLFSTNSTKVVYGTIVFTLKSLKNRRILPKKTYSHAIVILNIWIILPVKKSDNFFCPIFVCSYRLRFLRSLFLFGTELEILYGIFEYKICGTVRGTMCGTHQMNISELFKCL